MADLLYVYSVVPRSTDVAGAPPGLDEARVSLVTEGELAALVSRVDSSYADGLDDRLANVQWLGPRAAAHDGVLTWASDAGPVVPLPLLSLFRSDDAVRTMLRERRAELTSLIEYVSRGREYGVRVFRIDEELKNLLAEYSPAVHALMREAGAAAYPGCAVAIVARAFIPNLASFGVLTADPFSTLPTFLVSIAGAIIGLVVGGGTLLLVQWSWEKLKGTTVLGFGDVKMMCMVGAYLGIAKTVIVLSLAFALMLLLTIVVALTVLRQKNLVLPSGFIWGVPAIIVTLWGERILHWLSSIQL